MSRIGKKPVAVPSGVTATDENGMLVIKGPKGTLTMPMLDDVIYAINEGEILVKPVGPTQQARAAWGMQRTMVQNLVTGEISSEPNEMIQLCISAARSDVQLDI